MATAKDKFLEAIHSSNNSTIDAYLQDYMKVVRVRVRI